MDNPFVGVPAAPSVGAAPAAFNPFDPLAPLPADPFAAAPPLMSPSSATPTSAATGGIALNTFASPASITSYGTAPVYQQPAPPLSYETALVPMAQPPNPYASMVPQPHQQQQQPSNYQWGLDAGAAPATSPAASSVGTSGPPPYSAFGANPNTAHHQQQQQTMQPYDYNQQQPPPQQQPSNYAYGQPTYPGYTLQNGGGDMVVQQQPPQSQQQQQPPQPQPQPRQEDPPRHSQELTTYNNNQKPVDQPVESSGREIRPAAYEYGQRELPNTEEHRREDEFKNYVNPHRHELARQAPPGSSPLPKPELVRKKGYVLSRISFRTIVMKKWKQSFWVQYGPHTMLWFRNESDFSDWLNNPYHDQTTRNFLIKLAVNFVHDLYKPNVRGYQVTQCRTKAYGNKMVRQFKLERWMDYGPTIAAAFGSYNPKEIDDLRAAIVECMRNTPLNSGIRATGAVRQQQEQDREYDEQDRNRGYDDDRSHRDGRSQESEQQTASVESPPAVEEDLLDVNNWDDVPTAQPQQVMYGGQPIPAMSPYGIPPQQQQQQQQFYQQSSPQQQQQQQYAPPQGQYSHQTGYQNAMVPLANPPLAYPGAPPPPAAYQDAPSPTAAYQGAYQGAPPAPQQANGADPWAGQQPQYAPQQAFTAPPPYQSPSF